jgi:hypothetical protein
MCGCFRSAARARPKRVGGAKPKRRGAPIEVDVVQSEDGAEGLGKGLDGDRGVVHGLSG